MRAVFSLPVLTAALLAASLPIHAQDRATLLAAAGKTLQEQLTCLVSPKPGLTIRAMMRNGLAVRTNLGSDGIPVLRPAGNLVVFGKRVLFVSGREMEGDRVREPFERGPGTTPPHFIAVILDAAPKDVSDVAQEIRAGTDRFSVINPTDEFYTKRGTTITCYGE